MKIRKPKINAVAVAASLLLCLGAHAQSMPSQQQINEFFASNPTPDQIAAAAAAYGMNQSQISAAMGSANYGGSQAQRDSAINSWVGTQSNGYAWNGSGQLVKSQPAPATPAPVGVQQAVAGQGVYSPTQGRWISESELRQYAASNPSTDQMMQQVLKLGLNPYSAYYAAYVVSGATQPNDPRYVKLQGQLQDAMYKGTYGYGLADDMQSSSALVKGNGSMQYQMPDGSFHTVRMHNGVPDQSYEQVLSTWKAVKESNANGTAMDTSWQNGCYPVAHAAPPGAKICDPSQKSAYTSADGVVDYAKMYADLERNRQASGQTDLPVVYGAATAAAAASGSLPSIGSGPSTCQPGQVLTKTRAGISKCVGTPIPVKPTDLWKGAIDAAKGVGVGIAPSVLPGIASNATAQNYKPQATALTGDTSGFLQSNCNMENGQPVCHVVDPLPPCRPDQNPSTGCSMPPECKMENGQMSCHVVDGIGLGQGPVVWQTGKMPAGFIRAEPNWPGAMLVEGLGWIAPNGKGPAVEHAGTGGLEKNPNILGPGGTGGPDCILGKDGQVSCNRPPLLGTEQGPVVWQTGKMPAGYIRTEPNAPGARLVEGIGWIAPNGKGPALENVGTGGLERNPNYNPTGTGGMEPNPFATNVWTTGGSGPRKPEAR
ncbi:phage tail tape measure protein [Acidovorax soli]|nr:phage tail tape measure protein [Acidovorax soli]